jgi:pyridoxine kinase
MANLCRKADIIIPNLTEATLMLHQEYKDGPYTEEYIEDILRKLTTLGPKKIVLTGVFFDTEKLGAATYDKDTDKIDYVFAKRIEGMYHGTGDVFGSALIGSLLNDYTLKEAAQIAVNFTASSIHKTALAKTDIRFGVNFEQTIPELIMNNPKFKIPHCDNH